MRRLAGWGIVGLERGGHASILPSPWTDKVEILFSIICVKHPPRKHSLNELSFYQGFEPGCLLSGVLFVQNFCHIRQ